MAGDQQQRGGRDQVGVRHPSFGVGVGRQAGQHVLTRLLAAALDQPGHVLVQLVGGLFALLALLVGQPSRTFHDGGGPDMKLGFIFQWDTQ